MARHPIILVPPEHNVADASWHVAGLPRESAWTAIQADENPAAAIAVALRKAGLAGRPVTLALPSSWCLAATIRTDGVAAGDARALTYRLEERLPVAAEAVVADFIPAPDASHALGVCVRTDRVKPLLTMLEAAGVAIGSIAPLALLIAAGATRGKPTSHGDGRLLALATEVAGGTDLIVCRNGAPVAWTHVASPADLPRRVRWIESQAGPVASRSAVGDVDAGLKDLAFAAEAQSPAAAAVAGALDSGRRSAIELRRDALASADQWQPYRGGLRVLTAAAAIFFAAITVAALLRAAAHDRAADDATADVLQNVRTSFPAEFASASPDEIHAALAQERRSWANTAGRETAASPSAGAAPLASRSALRTVRDVLRLMPADAEIRIDRSTFDETTFEISGKARSYEDLDKLASAIRAGHPEVTLPQAARGPDGAWSFTMKGSIGSPVANFQLPIGR